MKRNIPCGISATAYAMKNPVASQEKSFPLMPRSVWRPITLAYY